MNVAPICILMVEDNEGDVLLTTEALKEAKVVTDLHVVRDGVEAVEFLYRKGPYSAAPRPDLILLDLNLPRATAAGPGRDQAGPESAAYPGGRADQFIGRTGYCESLRPSCQLLHCEAGRFEQSH